MPTVKIKIGKHTQFPNICPICEKQGTLKRYNIGSFFDDKARKKHVPIHKNCWRKAQSKGMIAIGLIIFLAITADVIFPETGLRREYRWFAIPIALLVLFFYPLPINIQFEEKYIEYSFKSKIYADKFNEINKTIKY